MQLHVSAPAHPSEAGGVRPRADVLPDRDRPRDPVQHELAQLWSELLGVSPVGLSDDFFELGGDSELAVTMMERIGALYGARPSPSVLTEDPTIRHLAEVLIAGADTAVSRPVCVQRGDDSRTPLFLFHGDYMGDGLYSRKLVKYLDAGQPVYVIGPHLPGECETIEEMAADILPRLRAIQPAGPYLFAGYCNGGLTALEVSQRLKAAGEQVSLLAVIDLSARNVQLRRLFNLARRATKLAGFSGKRQLDTLAAIHEPALRLLKSELPRIDESSGVGARLNFALAVVALAGKRIARRLWRALPGTARPQMQAANNDDWVYASPTTADELRRQQRSRHINRAMQCYVPRRYNGPITVIGVEDDSLTDVAEQLGFWRAVSPRLQSFTVPGDRGGAVAGHADALGEILQRQITQVR